MSRVGETGVGEIGIGEIGIGEMGVDVMGPMLIPRYVNNYSLEMMYVQHQGSVIKQCTPSFCYQYILKRKHKRINATSPTHITLTPLLKENG